MATTPDGETVRTFLDAGENAPRGAIITYQLPEAADPENPITLTFAKASGEEVRTFTSRTNDDKTPAKERRVPAKAGWNRFVWDLRYAPATRIAGSDPPSEETIEGPIVAPGDYTVTLKVGDVEQTQPLTIVKAANRPASVEDLLAQEDLLLRIHRQVDRTVQVINRMRDLRSQLDGWSKRTKEREGGADIAAAADALREQILEIEKTLLVPDLRPGWADSLNAGVKLLAKLAELSAPVALGDYPPTEAAEEVFALLTEQIEAEVGRFESLVDEELPKFNAAVKKAKLDAVITV